MAVNATAIWRVRPSGSNTNGGGYDPGIAGAATDYSQQNAAQATGVNGTASGTATFADTTAANFTAAMVGNALWIASGAGFTVGAYFIVTFNSATSVVLDRSPGTGTVAHWALGGGWADFWTNIPSGPIVNGNTVFILGSGTPNPSSYVYDYDATTSFNVANASSTVFFANDPATPGYKAPPDTTGGMPVIKFDVASSLFTWANNNYVLVSGLWFVGTTTAATKAVFSPSQGGCCTFGCVFDQFSFDCIFMNPTGSASFQQSESIGCEVFSSVTPGSAGSNGAYKGAHLVIDGCNIHDCVGYGYFDNPNQTFILNSIVAKNGVDGINMGFGGGTSGSVKNCTIDGNVGHGLVFDVTGCALNNIITNHTGAGKNGLTLVNFAGTMLTDYNTYYNNTTNVSGGSSGPHDTVLGVTPYVGSSTENYTLA